MRRRWRQFRSLIRAKLHGVTLGRGAILHAGSRLSLERGGSISIGAHSTIHDGAMLLSYGGPIRIGRNSSINPYCVLYGHGGLTIGDDVRIAAHCVLIPANHGFAHGEAIRRQSETRKGIAIGNDVWLGTGVRVLDGVRIGDGCVVAAGAVVTTNLEPDGIYAGVPARLLRKREPVRELRKHVADDESDRDIPQTVAAS